MLVGTGGREAALRDIIEDATGEQALMVPSDMTPKQLVTVALQNDIELTFVGPEGPLAAGVVNEFNRVGLKIHGPTKEAARIETDKGETKRLLIKHGIPTAFGEVFSDFNKAQDYINGRTEEACVVKYTGLAGGKGVFVCMTCVEAIEKARAILVDNIFKAKKPEILVEVLMVGLECSVFAHCRVTEFVYGGEAVDHKRLLDGDLGDQTGGMAAVSPVPYLTDELRERIMRDIFAPTLKALADDGRPYRGVLYAGLMITDKGPKVVEFNCRFGDPEAQAVLPRAGSDDTYDAMMATMDDEEPLVEPEFDDDVASAFLVAAAPGYPKDPKLGGEIKGLKGRNASDQSLRIYEAGVIWENGVPKVAGGRVCGVYAEAENLDYVAAIEEAEEGLRQIEFEGKQVRTDIAARFRKLLQPA